jgi:hypothetical protein
MTKPEPLEYQIARLSLAPGDVLVLKSNKRLQPELLNNFKKTLDNMIPKDCKSIILGPEFDLSVITRKDLLKLGL